MRVFASVLLAAVAVMSPSLLAQWPSVKTPNVPRNADGTVNAAAPAPRTADGKVDLSGLWEAGGGGGGGRGRRGQPPPAPPADQPPLAAFFDIGQNLPGGTPMTPWAAALRKERLSNGAQDNPDAHCLPIGHTQFHTHPQPRKIIQTPGEIVIIYESNYGLRHIYTDGREAPPPGDQDVTPYWYGYTVGKWEGDTLVATTTHIRDGMWLDVNGTPLTDQGKIVERFRRPSYGRLEIDITIEDPKAFTKPFTVRVNQRISVDTDLIEFICNENEKSSKHFVDIRPEPGAAAAPAAPGTPAAPAAPAAPATPPRPAGQQK